MMKSFGRFVTAVLVLAVVIRGCTFLGDRDGWIEKLLFLRPVYGEDWPTDAFGSSPEETTSLGDGETMTSFLENVTVPEDNWWNTGGEPGGDSGEAWPEETFGVKVDEPRGFSGQTVVYTEGMEASSGNVGQSAGGMEVFSGSAGQSAGEGVWPGEMWDSTGETLVGGEAPGSAGDKGLTADQSTVGGSAASNTTANGSIAANATANGAAAANATANGAAAANATADGSTAAVSSANIPSVCVIMRGGRKDSRGSWYYRADNCALEVILTPKSRSETQAGAFSDYKAAFHLLLDGMDYTDMADVETDLEGRIRYYMDAERVNRVCSQDGAHVVSAEAAGYGQLKAGGSKKQADNNLPCEGVKVQKGEAFFILDRKAPEFTVDIEAKNAEYKKPRKQGDRYYFNSPFRIRFTFYDENLEDDLVYVRRGEVSDGLYDSEEEEVLSFSQVIPCRGGIASERVKEEGIYRYMAGGCDKAGNALVPAVGAEADEEGRTRHIVVDRTKPSGTLILTAAGWDIFRMDSAGSILTDAVLPDSKEYGAVLYCSGEEEHAPVRYGISYRPDSAGKSKQENSGSFVRGLPWSVKLPGGGGFTIESWTMEDLAGNRTTVSLKRHFVPVKQTGSLSTGGGTGSAYSGTASKGSSSGSRTYTGSSSGGSSSGGSSSDGSRSGGSTSGGSTSSGGASSGSGTAGGSSAGRTSSGGSSTGSGSADFNSIIGTLLGSGSVTGTAADRTASGDDAAGGTSSGAGTAGDTSSGADTAGGSSLGGTSSGRSDGALGTGEGNSGSGRTNSGQSTSGSGSGVSGGGRQGNTGGLTDSGEKRRVINISIRWNGEGKETSCKYSYSTEDADARGELVLYETEAADGEEADEMTGDELDDAGISLAGESLADIISFVNNGSGKKAPSGRGEESVPTVRRAKLNITSEDFDPSRIIKGGDLLYLPEEGEWERELDDDGNTVWALPLTFSREGSYHVNVIRAKPVSGIIETLQSMDFYVAEEGVGEETGAPGAAGGTAAAGDSNGAGGAAAAGGSIGAGEAAATGGSIGAGGAADTGSFAGAAAEAEGGATAGSPAAADGPDGKRDGSGKAAIEIIFNQADACGKSVQGPLKPSFTVEAEEAVLIKALKVNGKEQLYERVGNQITLNDALEEEGLYELTLSVSDAAGAAADFGPVEVRIDNTPPHLEVAGIGERPETFYKKAEILVSGELEEASFCELTLDGEELDPDAFRTEDGKLRILLEAEGRHSFSAQLKDEAGNVSPRCVRTVTVAVGPLGLIRTRPAIPAGIAAALICLVCVIWIRRKEQGAPEEEEKPVSPWRTAHSKDLEQVKDGS